jgi:hypothetical protein
MAELVEELHALGVDINPSWTVPELRSVLMEQKEEHQSIRLPGLGAMELEELKQKAVELGIRLPDKPTRGWLMRMISDPMEKWSASGSTRATSSRRCRRSIFSGA